MSSIQTTERLLKRALLTNITTPSSSAITPVISGAHGEGKSAICRKVAEDLGGIALTVEGGSLKEGEITGIPFSYTNTDGSKEVRFVPYYQTGRIQQLEKKIKEIAQTTGFLGGTVKLNEDGTTTYKDSTGVHTIEPKTTLMQVIEGEDNKYKFGEDLPAEIKFKLLKSGEVMPIVLFIDEMNRTDNQTMKELMNIVLTRTVNGYKYPWWVFMVSAINPCGQDSVYSTNELDPAQLDRFLKINSEAVIEEWVEYAINNNVNSDYIIALSTNADIFAPKGKGYDNNENDEDLIPTPRSHEICSHIYGDREIISNSGFFTQEEIAKEKDDVADLIRGKLGMKAGRAMMMALRNKENFIEPADLIDGKSKTIAEVYAKKIAAMKMMPRRVLVRNVIRYISTTAVKTYYDAAAKGTATEATTKAKATWANIISQVKSLLNVFDSATQVLFAKDALSTNVNINDQKYVKCNKDTLFHALSCTFSTDIIAQVAMTSNIATSGDIDKK